MGAVDSYRYVPVKHPYVGGTRWNFMKWADIPDARDINRVYLRRLRVLQTPRFAIYLHFIYLPDEDRDPHDHPFNFWSFVVRGGYSERLWRIGSIPKPWQARTKTWRAGSLHRMGIDQSHMIDSLLPGTITLVLAGRKQKDWGFWTQHGYVSWRDYNRAKYDEHS